MHWPIIVWVLQLIPAAGLAATGIVLVSAAGSLSHAGWAALLLTIVGSAWFLFAAGPVVTEAGRRWLRERRRDWILTGMSTLVSLVLVDVFLSLSGIVPTLEQIRKRSLSYSFYEYAGYRMVPKQVVVDNGENITVNSRGFRGSEIAIPKPAGRKRIVFLGGSQVFDFTGGDWPRRAGTMLGAQGHDVDIVNAGVPGHNSTDSLRKLQTDIWTLEPDIVFACHGWNDIKYFRRIAQDVPYRGKPPPEPLTLSSDWRLYPSGIDGLLTSSAIYRRLRLAVASVLITSEGMARWQPRDGADLPYTPAAGDLGPRQFELNLRLIAALSSQLNAVTVFCRQAHRFAGSTADGTDLDSYARSNLRLEPADAAIAYDLINASADRVAKDEGVMIVDMDAALSADIANFEDGIHFSGTGSSRAADFVADALEPLFRKP